MERASISVLPEPRERPPKFPSWQDGSTSVFSEYGHMNGFKKRTYAGVGDFLRDVRFLVANRKRVRAILRGQTLSASFRERLMLAVTHVNQCRYCTRLHTKAALAEGMAREEIEAILHGEYQDCPAEEVAAILYAEHWAETEGRPDAESRDRVVQTYGSTMADAIDTALRIVKAGNYTGNTLDYFLYRVSFGRWRR
jgi:AhpD family alkylhydroperoxidase